MFKPRIITPEMAAQGYNNQGRGKLIGYVAVPSEHEETCEYRISTDGNPDKQPHKPCTCRIGLWQEVTETQKIVNEIRKTAKKTKRNTKTKTKKKKNKNKKSKGRA